MVWGIACATKTCVFITNFPTTALAGWTRSADVQDCRISSFSTWAFRASWEAGVVKICHRNSRGKLNERLSHGETHTKWRLMEHASFSNFVCPNSNNHGISKLVVWKSKRTLRKTDPKLSFLEGPSWFLVWGKAKMLRVKFLLFSLIWHQKPSSHQKLTMWSYQGAPGRGV